MVSTVTSRGNRSATLACGIATGGALATIKVRTAGYTHTGIASCVIAGDETEFVLEDASWDCREWQWWEDHGYGDEKRPRFVPATSGSAALPDGVRVSSAYMCDGIETVQEWWFRTQERDDLLTYDCRQTVTNRLPAALTDYGQFFACYTEPNRDKSQFYWAQDGQFKTFRSLGGRHVDAYIVAPGAAFERSGVIPSCATWWRPGGRYLAPPGTCRTSHRAGMAPHRVHRAGHHGRARLRRERHCDGLHRLSGKTDLRRRGDVRATCAAPLGKAAGVRLTASLLEALWQDFAADLP